MGEEVLTDEDAIEIVVPRQGYLLQQLLETEPRRLTGDVLVGYLDTDFHLQLPTG
jgi:hypothetical protein